MFSLVSHLAGPYLLRSLVPLLLFVNLVAGIATASPCSDDDPEGAVPSISLREVAAGFEFPVHIASAGDGSDRLFVVEQPGRIRTLHEGLLHPEVFLDIQGRVESGGERGMLGVAFHPTFSKNGFFFVNYTSGEGGLHTVVSRFHAPGGKRADVASEKILLSVDQPYPNHNGGQLAFGPDGMLYIGLGDGGSRDDPHGHGQNPATLLGALLRIDVNNDATYAIPTDNPFHGRSGFRGELWAYGLRNPWRFSFDAGTGRLYLADVGQDDVEEIDIIERGGNYGWNVVEGDICTSGVGTVCDRSRFESPLHTYRHPEGVSVTGGFVYRGDDIPGMCGVYLFADYGTMRVWGLRHEGRRITALTDVLDRRRFLARLRGKLVGDTLHISSFGQGEDLELYVAAHQAGRILRIVSASDR